MDIIFQNRMLYLKKGSKVFAPVFSHWWKACKEEKVIALECNKIINMK